MTAIQIFAKNNNKPGNIELVTFLEKNMEQLTIGGLRFKYKVIESKADEKSLIAKGIKRLPACVIDSEIYSGAHDMIEFMEKYINRTKSIRSKPTISVPDSEDDLNAYYAKEMTMAARQRDIEAGDDDDPKRSMEEAKSRAAREWQTRQENAEKPGQKSIKKRTDNLSAKQSQTQSSTKHKQTTNRNRDDNDNDDDNNNSGNDKRVESQKDLMDAIKKSGNEDEQLLASLYEES